MCMTICTGIVVLQSCVPSVRASGEKKEEKEEEKGAEEGEKRSGYAREDERSPRSPLLLLFGCIDRPLRMHRRAPLKPRAHQPGLGQIGSRWQFGRGVLTSLLLFLLLFFSFLFSLSSFTFILLPSNIPILFHSNPTHVSP